MKKFQLTKKSKIDRDQLFRISTDIENFEKLLPKYFKSLKITKIIDDEYFVDERIGFLGKIIQIKTKHVVIYPNIHKVYILSGQLRGTSFTEYYEKEREGTKVTINVNLKFNGIFNVFRIFSVFIKMKMDGVFEEFLTSSENLILNSKD